jgi:hypothetical protein
LASPLAFASVLSSGADDEALASSSSSSLSSSSECSGASGCRRRPVKLDRRRNIASDRKKSRHFFTGSG